MLKIQLEVVLALPKDVDIVRDAGVMRASNRKRNLEVEQLQGLCSHTLIDEVNLDLEYVSDTTNTLKPPVRTSISSKSSRSWRTRSV